MTFDDIKIYLPKYLSDDARKLLATQLKQFPNKGGSIKNKHLDQDLKDAIRLLKLWTKSEWTDFIQEKPSPLLHNTNKFIEYIEGRVRNMRKEKK